MTSARPVGKLPSPLAAVSLKIVGGITILASLIDFLVLLIPPDFLNRQWQIATTTQLVDRGIVPLVGIALLFTGYWIDSSLGSTVQRRSLAVDMRFWVCVLACILGVVFLVATVLHPNNIRIQSRDALAQVSQEAEQANEQLQQRLNAEVGQQRAQIDALLQNPEQLQAALESGQVTDEQRAQIEQFQNNPAALDEFLNSQVGQLQNQLQTEIGTRQTTAARNVRIEAWKSGIRIAVSSLLLALGYTLIGWMGLRRLMMMT
ncbi:hypothetical protein IQ241_15305 [Romeria aff. gracilis LEGE 07310]|uniref:Uncharacterized protein n=1 Tax=Vasconcelosia minhoensis LEGE 07310 TaxID=915328 RepID=A0A8J7AGT3_9CYAN|nr:HpsJ family protein [Romeria gracilis]MBE9078644.1 hypothetical protein [Romeria aff. gracilis LEGE 07310]